VTGGAAESDPDAREARLDEAIASYLEAAEAGKEPSREELLARYPDLAPDLEAFLDDQGILGDLHLGGSARPSRGGDPRSEESASALPCAFGEYELQEEIARGGMGVVFRAKQPRLQRTVALKMMGAGQFASPVELRRFQSEAKAAASLDHPHIVPIYHVGEHEGRPFYTMKFMEGGSLADSLSRITFDPRAGASLLLTVALAVDHAHRRGVLHRDLKPGNILLDGGGRPHVADFGLARMLADDSSFTASGAILGTPSYMAPEQATGEKRAATVASDVYSLGAILYELLAGRPPFKARSSLETIEMLLGEEPRPPRKLKPGVPRELQTICLKCLEKEPGRRYGSAADLALDISRFLEGKAISARPAGVWVRAWKWARRRPAAAALVAVIALALAGLGTVSFWYAGRLRHLDQQERTRVARGRYEKGIAEAMEAWRDGMCGRGAEALEEIAPREGEEDLRSFEWYHIWRLCHPSQRTLSANDEAIADLAFCEGSKSLATADRGGVVKTWDLSTGQAETLKLGPGEGGCLAISRDGKTIAVGGADASVRILDLPQGRIRATFAGHEGSVTCMGFSISGEILMTAGKDDKIKLWDARTGLALGTLTGPDSLVRELALSPDGKIVAVAHEGNNLMVLDRFSGEKLGDLGGHSKGIMCVAFSPDGKRIATGSWDSTVQVRHAVTRDEGLTFRAHSGPVVSVAFSPDSGTLATASLDRTVRLVDVATGTETRCLKGHDSGVRRIAFSPCGRMLASAGDDRVVKIWDLSAAAEPVAVNAGTGAMVAAAFLKGEQTLIASTRAFGLMVVDLERGTRAELGDQRPQGQVLLSLSSDGRAVSAGADHELRVWRVVREAGSLRLEEEACLKGHAAPVNDAAFSPDPTTLVSAGKDRTVRFWTPSSGEGSAAWMASTSLDVGAEDITDEAVSPDGKLLALARERHPAVEIWDIKAGRRIGLLEGHAKWVIALAFSTDSRRLATGSLDWTAKLWDLNGILGGGDPKPRELATFGAHEDAASAVVFSPDGRTLVTASDDRSAIFWDLATFGERARFEAHEGEVFGMVFSRDGLALACFGGKGAEPGGFGALKVWRAASEDEVAAGR
jgi:WD40 repeat protein